MMYLVHLFLIGYQSHKKIWLGETCSQLLILIENILAIGITFVYIQSVTITIKDTTLCDKLCHLWFSSSFMVSSTMI
jgi:hypothetical protein